jgi:hypothetical protein
MWVADYQLIRTCMHGYEDPSEDITVWRWSLLTAQHSSSIKSSFLQVSNDIIWSLGGKNDMGLLLDEGDWRPDLDLLRTFKHLWIWFLISLERVLLGLLLVCRSDWFLTDGSSLSCSNYRGLTGWQMYSHKWGPFSIQNAFYTQTFCSQILKERLEMTRCWYGGDADDCKELTIGDTF